MVQCETCLSRVPGTWRELSLMCCPVFFVLLIRAQVISCSGPSSGDWLVACYSRAGKLAKAFVMTAETLPPNFFLCSVLLPSLPHRR